MDNKLSELSKPVMYSITYNGVVEEIGGDSQGFVREEVQAELDSWENGSVGIPDGYSVSALYSQEYVSALLAELEAKNKRIAELEGQLQSGFTPEALAQEERAENAEQRVAELEAKLATPVRLPPVQHREFLGLKVDSMDAEQVRIFIRAAGFTVEGDE